MLLSGDVDAPRTTSACFGNGDCEQAVLEHCVDVVRVDWFWQQERTREPAMPAFNAVVLLAGSLHSCAFATHHNPALFGVNVDVLASQTGHFDGQHERASGLEQICGRCPAWGNAPHELPDVVVQRQQISERIPPRKGHVRIVACFVGRAPYVLSLQGYTGILWLKPYRRNGSARGS